MYIHKTTLDFLDFGYGSALATLMFVISMDGDLGLSALHAAQRGALGRLGSDVNFNRRAVVWFAAIIVGVNGFFPAVWILLTSFKTETELLHGADHLLAGCADARELRHGVYGAADSALHVPTASSLRACRRRSASSSAPSQRTR